MLLKLPEGSRNSTKYTKLAGMSASTIGRASTALGQAGRSMEQAGEI
jgi:hypothetical protein